MDRQTIAWTISNTSTNDVGYYTVAVIKGSEAVPSRQACLNVYITSTPIVSLTTSLTVKTRLLSGTLASGLDLGGGGMITIFGAPIASSGSSGQCPGLYSGYVNFTKTISQGWGWGPTTNTLVLTATDNNRTDTKIQYVGKYGDIGCNQTSLNIPLPAMSPKYRFTIFFPRGVQVPTNTYAITLTGFDP